MTMHRLFDDKVRPYSLIDVKTNSEESSCAKKLFLYGFLLSMLSHMNYIHIYSDNCLLSWAQVLWRLHRAEVSQDHHCVVLTRVNSHCLLWLSSFRLSVLVVLTMLFTVAECMNIFSFCLSLSFNFSFAQHQHQLNINCLTVVISLCCFRFETHTTMSIKARSLSWLLWVSYTFFCVWYWHWLQSHAHSDACGCEKHTASSSVSVTSVKCACVVFAASSPLSSEVVDSSHTSLSFIFFLVAATLLTSCSHDSLIVLICFCCLWCSKVIVTLSDHKCRVMKNVQCGRCFKNHKACDSICKTLMKHCVQLTILLDPDWVQCSSQWVIHCCHHHIWEEEREQRAGSAADELYQSGWGSLVCCRPSWSQKETDINSRDRASAAWEVTSSNLSLWRHAQFISCCGTLSFSAHYTCSYWHFQEQSFCFEAHCHCTCWVCEGKRWQQISLVIEGALFALHWHFSLI